MPVVVPSVGTFGEAGVLTIIQRAAPLIGLAQPSQVYGSADATHIELGLVTQEAAEYVIRAHDWSRLKEVAEFTGDGTTASFGLPDGFLRMTREGRVWSLADDRPLTAVLSADDWLNLTIRDIGISPGFWIILGGQMEVTPAPADGEVLRWYFQTRNAMKNATTGEVQARFEADTDTWALGDRLLETQIVWRWRQRKGLPYAEDMQNAEIALAQAISDDYGARTLTQRSKARVGGRVAYPWALGQ